MLGLGALALFALIFIPAKGRMNGATDQGLTIPAEVAPGVQPSAQGEANLDGRGKLSETPSSTNAQVNEGSSHSKERDAAARQEQLEARVAARIAELQDLSNKKDAASLETLLSEVRNTDPEIRQAALDAISQSGNRSAIPGLQEAAARTEDVGEKQAIGEVIEFLKLPTLTEIMREQRATNNNNARPDGP